MAEMAMLPSPAAPPSSPPPRTSPQALQSTNTHALLVCGICILLVAFVLGVVAAVYFLVLAEKTVSVYQVTFTELDGSGGGAEGGGGITGAGGATLTGAGVVVTEEGAVSGVTEEGAVSGVTEITNAPSSPRPPTLAPWERCRFSDSSDRRNISVPSSVSALMSDCRRCVEDVGFAFETPLCSLWCAPPDDAEDDPWIVLSRRNFSRRISESSASSAPSSSSSDCIFGSAAATGKVFASGFGCDEEVFLGLDKLVEATDPDGANRDMFEMRVVIGGSGSNSCSGSDYICGSDNIVSDTNEFFVDSSFGIFYASNPNARTYSEQRRYLASTADGDAFCANSAAAAVDPNDSDAACDPAVKGGYWRNVKTGDMSLCAACCEEENFRDALVGRHKIVEVLFRKKRCLHGDAETKKLFHQMRIPPVLECFHEGANLEVILKTPMGVSAIKGGKNKHKFWCSPTGGMKILERNPSLDAAAISDAFNISGASSASGRTKCLFDATEEDWSSSKYHDGFGCGHQFFIGTGNAATLSERRTFARSRSGSLDKGILKLKIQFDDDQNFEEEADIKKIHGLSLALDPSSISTRSDKNSILGTAYTGDIVSKFCDEDDVTACADLKSRWWLMRRETDHGVNEFLDNVCLTACDSKKLIKKIGSWDARDIKTVQMFIDNDGT